jgi:hypothetical protein
MMLLGIAMVAGVLVLAYRTDKRINWPELFEALREAERKELR